MKVRFRTSYWDVNHGRDEIMLKAIEDLPGAAAGVRLALQSGIEGFSHFLYSIDDAPFKKSPDGCITVHFEDKPSHQEKTIIVKAACGNGKDSTPYTVKLGYFPKEFYEANRMSGYPNILVVESDPVLNFACGSVEDLASREATPEEREFASKKWAGLVRDAETNYDKAKLLAKSLMDDLCPHSGCPSDEMKVSPFEQYERMVSGRDKGFCSNFACIFVCACNALGIPARRIGMQQVHSASDKCRIQRGSKHSTTEIFDRHSNQWIWMDMRYYVLGAYLGEEGPLNMAELHLFLNQSTRRERLKFHIYNLNDKSDRILPLDECPKKVFDCWEGWDVEFQYGKEIDG